MKKSRWILAGGLLVGAIVLFYLGLNGEAGDGPLAKMVMLLFGFSCLIVSGIIFSVDLVRVASHPFLRMIDGIYLPGGYPDKPPLSYELADYYAEVRDEPEKALEQYEKIIKYYPREKMAYKKMIIVLREVFQDQGRAEAVYRKAKRRIRSREDRKELHNSLLGNYGFPAERQVDEPA